MMLRLLDTSSGQAANPELLNEAREIVQMHLGPGMADKMGVIVELRPVEPVTLQITIKPAAGVLAPATPGISMLHVATHTLDKAWTFKKELEAVCSCGKVISRTEYISTLKHTASAHATEAQLLAAVAGSGLAVNGSTHSDDPAAQAAAYSACQDRCKAWEGFSTDMSPEDKMCALAGILGSSVAGYSDPTLYNLGLSEEAAAAFEDMSRVLLEDESVFPITSNYRPVRPPEEDSPEWVKATANVPLTMWALTQPWYLQYTASRHVPGVVGAELCLPARRAASRVRAEFPEMEKYDDLAYEEQNGAEAPKVTQEQVLEKLGALLQSTKDWRTPEQCVRRLGITLPKLAEMVNLKEIGGLAIDMCCRCGVFVLDNQPAVACEHCVDAYHLQCQNLKAVPDGDWICPGCTLASGATGKAALEAAARARTARKSGPKVSRAKASAASKASAPPASTTPPIPPVVTTTAPVVQTGPPLAADAGPQAPIPPVAAPPALTPPAVPSSPTPTTGRSSGPILAPQPPAFPPPIHNPFAVTWPAVTAAVPGSSAGPPQPPPAAPASSQATRPSPSSQAWGSEETESDMEDESAAALPNKRQRLGGGGIARTRTGNGPVKPPRNAQYRPNPADAQLYATNVPGMPMPSADGRTLVVRIATSLLNRQIAPISNRWCAQAVLSMKMLAGINCEYHYTVNTGLQPVILSEGTLVHGGVRCNRCRKAPPGSTPPPPADNTEPQPMQIDGQGNESVPVKREEADIASLPNFSTCNQVFRRIADFEAHLRGGTASASSHIWLPKHRLYLKGMDGTKGLMDLATEEAHRNPSLSVQLAAATEAAQEARKRAIEEGRDPDASDDDGLLNNLPAAPRGAGRQRAASAAAATTFAATAATATTTATTTAVVTTAVTTAAPAPVPSIEPAHSAPVQAVPMQPLSLQPVPVLVPPPVLAPPPVPPPGRRQRSAAAAAAMAITETLAPSPESKAKARAGIKKEVPPVLPGYDTLAVQREAARVKGAMALQLSEAKVLAALPRAGAPPENGTDAQHLEPGIGKLMTLAMVRGTGQYALLPKHALDAALASIEADGEDATSSEGQPVSRVPGIPVVPASLLPSLMEAGGTMLHVEPQQPSSPQEPAVHQAAGFRAGSQPAPESHATSAKVASLKLMRRFSALNTVTADEPAAAAVLKGLKTCREAANQIPDAQLQLESMGFIADLVTQFEALLKGGAPSDGGDADNSTPASRVPKLTSMLDDVHDLKSQLEEWAGVKKAA